MRSFVRRIALLVLVAGAAVALSACDSREDEVDLERQRALYLALQLLEGEARDFTTPCIAAVSGAFSCASDAGRSNAEYLMAIQSRYGFTTDAGDASGVCADYPNGSFFDRWTAPAKKCYFECAAQFWTGTRAAGFCTSAEYATVLENADAEILRCTDDCQDATTFLP